MKRKLLFISMVLTLVLTTLAPAPVLAKDEKGFTPPEAFAAKATVWVTDPGHSTAVGPKIITRGEIIEGVFTQAENFLSIEGALLSVKHNSVITLSPDGTFAGEAKALVTVSPLSGGRIFGRYHAALQGEYHFVGGQLVIDWVTDTGTFSAQGHIFDEDGRTLYKAEDEWAAALLLTQVGPNPEDVTLVGEALLEGHYRKLVH
jgi:hypothetical protein